MAEAETCRRELEFTVEWADVEKDVAKVVNGFRRQARLPGFRPGKAPAALVRSRYWKDIKEEVLKNLLPRVFWDKAREEGLKVVGSPNLTDLHFENGEPVKFQTEFDIYPEFELGEYRRIEVPYSEPEVLDDEVNLELEHLRERNASYRNLDPRPLADGDIAVLKLTGEPLGGGPKVEQNEMMITIGEAETLPEFSENLRGMSPGDAAEFNVKYPDDYGTEKLAGKTLAFHAEVLEMREKELPELDDDFAQEAGEYSSLEELKNQIREAIGAHRRRIAAGTAKNKLVDALVDRHRFPVPETMVEQQAARQAERQLRALEEQGADSSNDRPRLEAGSRERKTACRAVCAHQPHPRAHRRRGRHSGGERRVGRAHQAIRGTTEEERVGRSRRVGGERHARSSPLADAQRQDARLSFR